MEAIRTTIENVMMLAVFFFPLWLIHAALAGILSSPIVALGWNRVKWRRWELMAFVLPFCIWLVCERLTLLREGSKGLNNLIEPVLFGAAIPIAAMSRVLIGKRFNESRCAAIVLVCLCLVAALVYFFTPDLGGTMH